MNTKILTLTVLAFTAVPSAHAAGKISKATAAQLVGTSGITAVQLNRLESKLLKTTRLLKDMRPNQRVDNFELAAAIKQSGLNAGEKTAMWSAKGNAAMTSDPDGMNNIATKAGIVGAIRGNARDLRGAMKGGKLTADSLYAFFGNATGKAALSNVERAFLRSAQAER
jgi:hypothetical protein